MGQRKTTALALCLLGSGLLATGIIVVVRGCGGSDRQEPSERRARSISERRDPSKHFTRPVSVTPLVRINAHRTRTRSVAFSPDGSRLATSGDDRSVRIWELPSGHLWREIRGEGPAPPLALRVEYSRNGQFLATGGQRVFGVGAGGGVTLYDPSSGEEVIAIRANEGQTCLMALAPDGRHVATGDQHEGAPERCLGEVKVWTTRGELVATFPGHPRGVTAVAFSPDGRMIASSGRDMFVRLWRVADRSLAAEVKAHPLAYPYSAIAFSPDGRRLASVGPESLVCIWRLPAAKLERVLPCGTTAMDIEFLPGSNILAVAGYHVEGAHRPRKGDGPGGEYAILTAAVRFWDAASGEELGALTVDPGRQWVAGKQIRTIDVSADGKLIAAGSEGGSVTVWELGRVPLPRLRTTP